eukprot:SM000069S20655  [mRNA]  locus=s69:26030:28545:+ [translate_table: standard]
MAARPEAQAPPEVFYSAAEARKYTTSSRIVDIQARLTERAVELLALPDDGAARLLLDVGCGSGLSGEALTEAGHHWIGCDISPAMLDVALDREVEGDLLLEDMGQGLGLRPGVIDGAISISAVQWLCNADKTANEPRLRLRAFFQSLYRSLAKGGRAVLQLYPDGQKQLELISTAAMKAGFAGGLVIDYPHSTKAKKYYLVLAAGLPAAEARLPKARGEDGGSGSEDESDGDVDNTQVIVAERERSKKRASGGAQNKRGKGRAWLLRKKEQRRNKGFADVPGDTKYTGRKRKDRF